MGRSGEGLKAGNLRSEATSFIGRGREVSALADLLVGDRLVTLTGVGGVGKTRLAQRAGAEVRAAFPDGVWLVELSPLNEPNPNLIALSIYEALQLADQSTRPAIEVVAEWLADKQLLLILDCCEHLATECAEVVKSLLAAAPGVHILATGRSPLGIRDERQLRVPPLPVTATCGLLGRADSEAALLFLERARSAAPGTVLSKEDGATIAEVCARLEGIPLAIELAAARLLEMSLDQLSHRLHTRFETLTAQRASGGEGEPRHRALRTTIGWSHELCAPLERLLWTRLAVFVGGFEQEAAQWVCAGGPLSSHQVPSLLNRLVDQSILQCTDTPRGPRYSMLDTIREYGQHWLARLGEEPQLRERHRDYYRWLAQVGDREWAGPGQVAWYERLTAEHANLRAALEGCLTDPEPRLALEMASDLWFFWTGCGLWREGRSYLERALAEGRAACAGRELFWALWACAFVATLQGDFEVSAELEGRASILADRLADPAATAAVRYVRGTRLAITGHPAQTLADCGQELHSPPARGRHLAIWLLALGVASYAHLQLGEVAQATALADSQRKESERHDDLWVRGYALYFLAMAALANGDPAAATRHARDSLTAKWQLHDTFGAAVNLDTLAISVAASAPERAARLLGTADQLWRSIGRDRARIEAFLAARHACEHQLRETLGDAPYETAHRKGLETGIDAGVTYALRLE
ncbi:ATP-binding protein [Streptomyces sp. NPDC055239]